MFVIIVVANVSFKYSSPKNNKANCLTKIKRYLYDVSPMIRKHKMVKYGKTQSLPKKGVCSHAPS